MKNYVLVAIFIVSFTLVAKPTNEDLIKTINLTAGTKKVVLISDLFYAPNYKNVVLKGDNKVTPTFNSSTQEITLAADAGAEGFTVVSLTSSSKTYAIPVVINQPIYRTFNLRPSKKYAKLNLFGSFNSWNRDEFPMTDPDGDGVFSVTIPVEPGNYQYRFFADGVELTDPKAEDSTSNGFGGYNSLVLIKPKFPVENFAHLAGFETQGANRVFKFNYTKGLANADLSAANVYVLVDNQIINEAVKISGSQIHVTIKASLLQGKKYVRVVVEDRGQVAPMQSILTYNSKPYSNKDPFTWYDAIIYSIMVDRFFDGDVSINKPLAQDSLFPQANYRGGDFAGLSAKLNDGYFNRLGVNTVWLSPVYQAPNVAHREFPAPYRWFSGYHGYWPSNSTDVEEQFGTMKEFKEVVKLFHKKDIKVLLDVVANHVHESNEIYKKNPDWFGQYDLGNGRKNLRLWDEYRLTTWFETFLPKFDFQKSPAALNWMTENAIWWLKETGADGFRQDAVKHIPNEFWRTLTRKLHEKIPNPTGGKVYQIGETFGGYDLISSYVNNGQLSSQFNFNLYDTAIPVFTQSNGDFSILDKEMKRTFNVYGMLHEMGNVMDSHDKIRYAAYTDGDIPDDREAVRNLGWEKPPIVNNPTTFDKQELYLTYMLTIPGIPVIYYGSEFGMTGAEDPDNRRMMRFDSDLNPPEKALLDKVIKRIQLRKSEPALRYGDFFTLKADKDVYAYVRSNLDSRLVVALNKGAQPVSFTINLPDFYTAQGAVNVIDNSYVRIIGNKLEVSLPAYGNAIFKLQ